MNLSRNVRVKIAQSHYLFEPVPCTLAAGWEKGQLERRVGFVRQRLFAKRRKFDTLEVLNVGYWTSAVPWQPARSSRSSLSSGGSISNAIDHFTFCHLPTRSHFDPDYGDALAYGQMADRMKKSLNINLLQQNNSESIFVCVNIEDLAPDGITEMNDL